ncbi:MAG: 1,2-phenylacetyl-CoA epoxidase subunit PaaC [Pseudomonadota bacterium]|jgi:ring-1,2-phenylacetyl-CoA epoxidase subunit PaaC
MNEKLRRPLFEYLLRLGDNVLILGQRLGEWVGHGPALEEEMANANLALDLIGQARLWLTYAGEVEGRGRDEDRLAFLRHQHEFRNVLLVERPNGDYAHTIVRQFFFDAWHCLLLTELKKSADARMAGIAEKSLKEATYHLERSEDWVVRLGDGTEESHGRMLRAVDELWTYTGELFQADAVDHALCEAGIAPDPSGLCEPWQQHVRRVFGEATLPVPGESWMQSGGKQGRHTEALSYLLAEMQFLQRAYPGAQW